MEDEMIIRDRQIYQLIFGFHRYISIGQRPILLASMGVNKTLL